MAHSAAVPTIAELPTNRVRRPIDLVHLAKQCLGDEQLEHEILRMFDTTVRSYLARLDAADGAEQVVHVLHAIRGSASGVGAFTVADLARAAEVDVREGRPLGTEIIADLAHAIEEVGTFIDQVLGSKRD